MLQLNQAGRICPESGDREGVLSHSVLTDTADGMEIGMAPSQVV